MKTSLETVASANVSPAYREEENSDCDKQQIQQHLILSDFQ